MKTYFSITAIVLLLSLHAVAAPFSFRDMRDEQIYRELLREYSIEIGTFDQTKEAPEVLAAFAADWKAFITGKAPLPKKWREGYSWSAQLNQFFIEGPSAPLRVMPDDNERLKVKINTHTPHSIEDAVHYSEERVGGEITKVLRKNKIRASIYGGTKESVANALKVDGAQIKYLPSPYDAWGIHKAFIPSTATIDKKPRYLMVIPPSRQYVIHYAGIFSFLDIDVENAILNHTDQRRQVDRLRLEFQRIARALPAPVDVLALGYYNVIQENNEGMRAISKEMPMSDGLTVQMLEETRIVGKPVRYLIVKSDMAIWGESSSLMVEAALSLKPRAVIFMGSAGGIRETTHHYDISVPLSFQLGDRQVDIKNAAIEGMTAVSGPWRSTVVGAKHGHTNSPIEQTKAYVEKRVASQIDSYDVEQNLIADIIAEYNKRADVQSSFIALNLITDKPSSFTHEWKSDHDLSRVNRELKADARRRAVNLALMSVRASPTITRNLSIITCDRALLP